MFTPDERRALLFLGAVAVAGGVVRAVRARTETPSAPQMLQGLPVEDVRAQLARVREAEARQRPLAAGERIDIDRAGAVEIERLPRVGPELARRIVEDREKNGPFGSIEALETVPGVGPGLVAAIGTRLRFSGVPRTTAADAASSANAPPRCDPGARVAINRADVRQLDCLPGIGPALARRIVEDRQRLGPYRQVEDLQRVPGIGPSLTSRLAPRLTVP